MEDQNYYEILGIPMNSQSSEIKKAYKILTKKFHPDLNKQTGSEELFKIVQKSYETLIDNEARREYDEKLQQDISTKYNQKDIKNDYSREEKDDKVHYFKKAYYHFSDFSPRFSIDFLSLLRKIIAVFFIIIILALLLLADPSWNQIVLYFGWLLFFFVIKKGILILTNLGLIIWFVVSLFQGNSSSVLYSIGAIFLISLIFVILFPDEF